MASSTMLHQLPFLHYFLSSKNVLKSLFCWWTCSHSLHHCVFMPFFKFLYYHFAKVSGGSGDKHMVSLPSWPGNLLVDNGLFLIFLVIILISLNNMQIFLFVNLFITFRHYLLTSCYLNHQLPSSLAPHIALLLIIYSLFLTFVPLNTRLILLSVSQLLSFVLLY